MKYALLALSILFGFHANGQVGGGIEAAGGSPRDRILAVARSLVGTREATGNNDGPAIDGILASVGLEGTQAPYCAAFNRFCYDRAGLRLVGPRSALAAVWVRDPTWTLARGGATPKPADAWGIYFPSKGRVAHTGLVSRWGERVVVTIEGNTSPDAVAGSSADRNGDGVWSKRRLTRQIYAVRDWFQTER
jgi:hypothetical protein